MPDFIEASPAHGLNPSLGMCFWCGGSGVFLAEVSETPEPPNQPPIQEGLYPTGRYAVVTEEGVRKMFDPETAQGALEAGRAFLDEEAFALFEKAAAPAGADR